MKALHCWESIRAMREPGIRIRNYFAGATLLHVAIAKALPIALPVYKWRCDQRHVTATKSKGV
jgi:hypothetical protein